MFFIIFVNLKSTIIIAKYICIQGRNDVVKVSKNLVRSKKIMLLTIQIII